MHGEAQKWHCILYNVNFLHIYDDLILIRNLKWTGTEDEYKMDKESLHVWQKEDEVVLIAKLWNTLSLYLNMLYFTEYHAYHWIRIPSTDSSSNNNDNNKNELHYHSITTNLITHSLLNYVASKVHTFTSNSSNLTLVHKSLRRLYIFQIFR